MVGPNDPDELQRRGPPHQVRRAPRRGAVSDGSRSGEAGSRPNSIVTNAMQAQGNLPPPAQQTAQNFTGTHADRGPDTKISE